MKPLKKSQFKPMLAASATNEDILNFQFPLIAAPKLDGIRAIVLDGVVYSRSLKPIRNKQVQELFGHLEGFDGELILGDPTHPDCFNRSTALMGEQLREDVQDLEIGYWVFDLIPATFEGTFVERFDELTKRVQDLDLRNVHLVKHQLVNSLSQLEQLEEHVLEEGYEGLMVRDPNGIYKQGRSTLKQRILTKVKRFQDDEAEVIGFEPKRENIGAREINELGYSKTSSKKDDFILLDTLGSLIVRDLKTGIEFSIGSGYTFEQRDHLWSIRDTLLGKIVRYTHFTQGVKSAPRFPTFDGFRDPDDM